MSPPRIINPSGVPLEPSPCVSPLSFVTLRVLSDFFHPPQSHQSLMCPLSVPHHPSLSPNTSSVPSLSLVTLCVPSEPHHPLSPSPVISCVPKSHQYLVCPRSVSCHPSLSLITLCPLSEPPIPHLSPLSFVIPLRSLSSLVTSCVPLSALSPPPQLWHPSPPSAPRKFQPGKPLPV